MFKGLDLNNLNLNDMLGQVKDMAEKAKEENVSKIFTAKAGGGMIEISANGNSEVVDIKIDDSLLEDKDALQILLISCITDILKQVDENRKSAAMNMMGNLGNFGKDNG